MPTWLAVAEPLTFALSTLALVVEFLVLRGVSRRSGLVSVLSGIGAFGGLALANRLGLLLLMDAFHALAPVDLGYTAWAWLTGFVAYDAMFYVSHRLGHRVRLLWCFHSVHHTTEEMRLTSAVRGSVFDVVYLPWFFVWIPLLGVPPVLMLAIEATSRLWGVATHVSPQWVGRLGALDRWLVTPSVHRVHHGRNLPYLDRNYGEVLLVWDHLFGTHQPEHEAPDYGVLADVDSESFVDVQLSPWRDLWADLRRAPDWASRLRYLLDAPGWKHDGPDARVSTLQRG